MKANQNDRRDAFDIQNVESFPCSLFACAGTSGDHFVFFSLKHKPQNPKDRRDRYVGACGDRFGSIGLLAFLRNL